MQNIIIVKDKDIDLYTIKLNGKIVLECIGFDEIGDSVDYVMENYKNLME